MNIFQKIDQAAVVAWDDFLKGVHWMAAEAKIIAAGAAKLDPALQVQLQDVLTAGEAAAVKLASKGETAMVNVIATGAGDIETVVANFVQAALGGTTSGAAVSGASVTVLKTAASALEAAVPIAVAKIAAALIAAAA